MDLLLGPIDQILEGNHRPGPPRQARGLFLEVVQGAYDVIATPEVHSSRLFEANRGDDVRSAPDPDVLLVDPLACHPVLHEPDIEWKGIPGVQATPVRVVVHQRALGAAGPGGSKTTRGSGKQLRA